LTTFWGEQRATVAIVAVARIFSVLDHTLIQQIEEMTSGETVHYSSNLVGAYRAAHMAYDDTGDAEFLAIASEAECGLRILLTKLRHQRAAFTRWI